MKKILLLTILALTLNITPATASEVGLMLQSTTLIAKDQKTALKVLRVADEVRTGYVRTKFKHWITISRAGQLGCDSRKSVIIDEALVKPTIGKDCSLTGGKWLSIYDNVEVTDASKLDVDHMVPLAEAWDSGASTWTDLKRQQYANDMTDPRHLIAVTGSSNRSKSDQDPADWVPTNKSYVCEYINNWISIKLRWSLTIDAKEKTALESNLKVCKPTKIIVSLVK
jgi:Protein of unknown function (DUF1524)